MSSRADHDVSGVAISTVGPPQWLDISRALAAAFDDDPVLGWLLPNAATRPAALQRYFAIETRHIVLGHARSVAGTDGTRTVGAALVLPPGEWRTPVRVQALHSPSYLRIFGRQLPRALGVLTAIERRHPRHPHVYLPYIGVVPTSQGHGLGRALLAPVLERCDQDGLPAYLEASSPRSAKLYERLGFTTIERIRPFGAPPIELMSRDPSAERGGPKAGP